jgi:hypothetical protein
MRDLTISAVIPQAQKSEISIEFINITNIIKRYQDLKTG